jgi:hypothetical protein
MLIMSKFFLKSESKLSQEKNALIFGNGPSLSESVLKFGDLKSIKKTTDVYCVNHFASSDEYEQIRPQKYYMLDPAFADKNDQKCYRLLEAIRDKTSWKMEVIVPYTFKKGGFFSDFLETNPCIQISYFNYTIIKGFKWFEDLIFRLGLGNPVCQNVLVGAIFLTINRKYSKVVVLGADHTWHENLRVSDENNQLILSDQHFYGKRERIISEEFYDKSDTTPRSALADQFISLYKVFKTHERLAIWAADNGVLVLNASEHSNIDVYPRLRSERIQDFVK